MDQIGCTICLDPFDEDRPTCVIRNCGHTFHRKCIEEWMQRSTTCPTCRIPCSSSADLQKLIISSVPGNKTISDLPTGSGDMELKYAVSQSALDEMTVKLGEVYIEKVTLIEDVNRLKNQIEQLRSASIYPEDD